MKAIITDIQRFSIHDGPGIRTLIFLKGCPLRCPWCCNPETQLAATELLHCDLKCIHCDKCVGACTRHALNRPGLPFVDCSRCNLCGDCILACPTGALQRVGKAFSVQEVCETVEKDRIFYEESNGGVTFSGGEPLLQAEFLEEALQALRASGIHTAVETCGHVEWSALEQTEKSTDLFLYDLKIIDTACHLRTVGVDNTLIINNLRKLAARRNGIVVRIPVIPGFTLPDNNIPRILELAASLPSIRTVHLLPYHDFGKSKYSCVGRSYSSENVRPPSPPELAELATAAKRLGLECTVGG